MTHLEFRNRLAILRSIDRHELVEAGAIGADDFTMWNTFLNNPEQFFLLCEDHRAEKIWRVIERRASPSVNWDSSSEALIALNQGILPDGFSVDKAGTLVIPDEKARCGLFGHLIVIQQFDRVVTASGTIMKDRDGALKAGRAS